jgi:hypothetical protein
MDNGGMGWEKDRRCTFWVGIFPHNMGKTIWKPFLEMILALWKKKQRWKMPMEWDGEYAGHPSAIHVLETSHAGMIFLGRGAGQRFKEIPP